MSEQGRVIRLFRFRPVKAEFDDFLRTRMVPDLRRVPGVLDVHVGRRGLDLGGDRVVASIWRDRASMTAGVGRTLEESLFHPEHLADTTEQSLEVHELSIVLPFDLPEPPALLRLFRGSVRPGELDAYIDETRAGTLADSEAGRGPCALYLAPDPPDRFVTVSLWSSWAAIEAATGGDIRRPTVTKDSKRLVGIDVAHYEVVTDLL